MMNKYNHIIWDWNGTLLDDVWLCIEIMNGMLSKRNLPGIDHRTYLDIFDFPVQDYYAKAGFDFYSESFESLAVEYCDVYAERVEECELQKDAWSVLDSLNSNHVSQTILSATGQDSLENMINHFDLKAFFNLIVGQNNQLAVGKIEKGKQLLKEIDIEADKTVLIGDTTHDVEVAEALGIDCVLVQNGHHAESKLNKTSATVVKDLSYLSIF
ncbi:MAG: HAD family hydrolase [Proteobacteria bacterium]|nr:HAD family hydrolase [Pseudomonadota bacterium]